LKRKAATPHIALLFADFAQIVLRTVLFVTALTVNRVCTARCFAPARWNCRAQRYMYTACEGSVQRLLGQEAQSAGRYSCL